MPDSFIKQSKLLWQPVGEEISTEQIQIGCLQRMAEAAERTAVASETMAQNFLKLQSDRDMYERWYRAQLKRADELERSNRTLKGWITRLKKKLCR